MGVLRLNAITVLICDDNEAVHESLTSYFNTVGIQVVSVFDGSDALSALRTEKLDLVILDVMMPKMSGIEVCKAIRKTSDIPIIMLSARGEELDRILGLELGADDYITKPFSPREVATRVLVVLKRAAPKSRANIVSFMELHMNLAASEVWIGDKKISFTIKEKAMIEIFLLNPGVALSRNQIMDAVWGDHFYGDTRAVDTFVKRIRKKLPEEGVHFEIASVYGLGYRLQEKV